jgi:hypothetical protein
LFFFPFYAAAEPAVEQPLAAMSVPNSLQLISAKETIKRDSSERGVCRCDTCFVCVCLGGVEEEDGEGGWGKEEK